MGSDIKGVLAAAGLMVGLSGAPALAASPSGQSGATALAAGVTARDADGTPTFLRAAADHAPPPAHMASAERAARWYLGSYAAEYGLSPAHLDAAVVLRVHDTGRGGIVVIFGQQLQGVPVAHVRASVLLRRSDLGLVAIGGALSAARLPAGPAHHGSAAQAVARAATHSLGIEVQAADLLPAGGAGGGWQAFELDLTPAVAAAGRTLQGPARARPVLFERGGALVEAFEVEVAPGPWGGTTSEASSLIVDDAGEILFETSLVDHESFTYRVWASPDGDQRPAQGPHDPYAPHPSGADDGSFPAFTEPALITLSGLSFDDGRAPDPWLPDGATLTDGNNVRAYADHVEPDGFSEGDRFAMSTSPGAFDCVFDLYQEPLASTDQIDATLVQLFYTTNWLHDFFYDSGFDEAGGNAQSDNYGRGGLEGDPLLAEGQDSALDSTVRNNANMTTPADGASPRMQMYLWSGEVDAQVLLQGRADPFQSGYATFGLRNFEVSGRVVVPTNRLGQTVDGCDGFPSSVAGRVAIVTAPECYFQDVAVNAERAGATGLLIGRRDPGQPAYLMGPYDTSLEVNIPLLSLTQEDAAVVFSAIAQGVTLGTLTRATDVERDSSLDGMIVSHEWGHYLHRRLVSPCANVQCRALSEGAADFIALHTVYTEGADRLGAYGVGIYADHRDDAAGFFGTRRVAYSRDPALNALDLRDIQDSEPPPEGFPFLNNGFPNSEIHNAGEIWASMMWDLYMDLMAQTEGEAPRYTYEQARRLMADDIVTAYSLAPPDTTFLEMRDALLAATAARDATDFGIVVRAFARRGAGSCAVGPERESETLDGVEADYSLNANLRLLGAWVDDSVSSCDNDGALDAGEVGVLHVTVFNVGGASASGATLAWASDDSRLAPVGEAVVVLPDIEGGKTLTVQLPITLATDVEGMDLTHLDLDLRHEGSCEPHSVLPLSLRINYDDNPQGAALDTFESQTFAWTAQADVGHNNVWAVEGDDTNHELRGVDPGMRSDVHLTSPALVAAAGQAPVITFKHRYSFETSEEAGQPVFWDGGVVEISDDGQLWSDLGELSDLGYGGQLSDLAENPLAYRDAYVGQSPDWPAMHEVRVQLPPSFEGATFWLRFRIGADLAVGAEGWFIDDVDVQGLQSAPFPYLSDDAAAPQRLFNDNDGDGHGAGEPVLSCQGEGLVASGDDCDDADAQVSPEATERCDGEDNDCDGAFDEQAADADLAYADADGDGFGAGEPTAQCQGTPGYSPVAGDCDDSRDDTYPGASEPPGAGSDLNCDGAVETPTPTQTPERTPTPTPTAAQVTDTQIPTPTSGAETQMPTPTSATDTPIPTATPGSETQMPTAAPTDTQAPTAATTDTQAPTAAPGTVTPPEEHTPTGADPDGTPPAAANTPTAEPQDPSCACASGAARAPDVAGLMLLLGLGSLARRREV